MGKVNTIMSDILQGNRVTLLLRVIMGLLFIYSGIFKAVNPENFSIAIHNYDILGEAMVPYTALIIPWIEMITGVLLVIGWKIKPASLILTLLMMVFTAAIALNVIRGRSFDCGCFELNIFGISETVSISLVIRDLLFTGILLLVFAAKNYPFSIDCWKE